MHLLTRQCGEDILNDVLITRRQTPVITVAALSNPRGQQTARLSLEITARVVGLPRLLAVYPYGYARITTHASLKYPQASSPLSGVRGTAPGHGSFNASSSIQLPHWGRGTLACRLLWPIEMRVLEDSSRGTSQSRLETWKTVY